MNMRVCVLQKKREIRVMKYLNFLDTKILNHF